MQKKDYSITDDPINKLFIKIAIPSTVGTIFQTLYNSQIPDIRINQRLHHQLSFLQQHPFVIASVYPQSASLY